MGEERRGEEKRREEWGVGGKREHPVQDSMMEGLGLAGVCFSVKLPTTALACAHNVNGPISVLFPVPKVEKL